MDAKLWTIPGERMRTGIEHRVPLSPASLALLRDLPREGDDAGDGFSSSAASRASRWPMSCCCACCAPRATRRSPCTA
jgi:integrase